MHSYYVALAYGVTFSVLGIVMYIYLKQKI